jgi:hypothetical protein
MQFNFGAILGSSFIFYFQSATLSVSWPFLVILLLAMFANEFWKKNYERLIFQISFLYLSTFAFTIFIVPIVVHRIGVIPFLGSGVISLLFIWLFIKAFKFFAHSVYTESRKKIIFSISTIFILTNIFYFLNIIPPIPLVLKDSGIYHSVLKTSSGEYDLIGEEKSWLDWFSLSQKIRWANGESLYAYSAVFSPADFDTNIIHEWQYKNDAGEWVTSARIPLKLSGGRQEGFRTYSVKSGLSAGQWRVNVTTSRGAVIGRINFKIISTL